MPNVTLNTMPFTGTMTDAKNNSVVTRIAPQRVWATYSKPGKAFVAPNGTRTLVQRAVKKIWHLEWDQTTPLTQSSVETVAQLSTPFTMIVFGASVTVQCESGDDYEVDPVLTLPNSTIYYDLRLTLYEP